MESQASYRTLQPGEMLNWYQIDRILGRGGFGVIYLATDTNLDHQVAIKEYLPSDVATRTHDSQVHPITDEHNDMYRWGMDRFIKEARNLVKFKHPNIVRVMSVFQENNTAYMVMEFEEGEDLRKHLRKTDAKSEESLKQLILPISEGLAEVHRHGFIHRDIKPANILVRKDGSTVLLDFGSARNASKYTQQSLTALVSVGYAPLEQYNSEADEQQGPWTDIYALGGTLYYAISGKDPVESTRRGAAVLNGGADPLIAAEYLGEGKYSVGFLRAIDWAMQFPIADRPQTLSDWIPALLAKNIDPIPKHTRKDNAPYNHSQAIRPSSNTRGIEDLSDATVLSRERRTNRQVPGRRLATAQPVKRRTKSSMRWPALIALMLALVAVGLWYSTDQRNRKTTAEAQTAIDADANRAKLEAQKEEQKLAEAKAQRDQQAQQAEADRQAELEQQRKDELEKQQKEADEQAERIAETKRLEAEALAKKEAEKKQAEADAKIAEQAAAEKARADEIKAAELARITAETKAEWEREAQRLERQAEVRAAELDERRLKQTISAAQNSLSIGDLNAAKKQLKNAQLLAASDARVQTLAFALQTAVDEHNKPVSDDDFEIVSRRFDALKRAIENKDADALDRLATPSQQSDLFKRLMKNNYDRIEVSISAIRVHNVDKSITGTLQIDSLIRPNGDRSSLSEKYTTRAITSRRINGGWSKIEW